MDLYEYRIERPTQVDAETLVQALARLKVPHTDSRRGSTRIVRMGAEGEYELRAKTGRKGAVKASILIRFEHPVLKNVIAGWLEKCGTDAEGGFYTWHSALSPAVLRGIRARWQVDFSGFAATPVSFGLFVMVFVISGDVSAELEGQLAAIPHRKMASNEFLKCADFNVCGDDPFDTTIYGWLSEVGARLYVITAAAPAQTIVSLWVLPGGAPVECNIELKL